MRRAGRAVRARVRRAARQPLVRRRPGLAHVLRARPDRPAAAARRLSVADAPGARAHASSCSRAARCSTSSIVDGKARGIIVRNLVDRRDRALRRRRRDPGHRRLRHRLLPVDQRGELQRHRGVARAQARRAVRQPVLHADSPDLHSGQRRAPVEAHADEREPPQRRPRLGAEEEGRQAPAGPDSRRASATTTSNGSIRASATWCRATSPRATPSRSCDDGRGVGESGLAVYLDFADAIKRLGLDDDPGEVRQPLPHVQEDHRRGCRTRCRCASTRRSTTRWAGSGSTTT